MNPADILSKHWGYQQVWTSALRPLLFWMGDTSTLLDDIGEDDGETDGQDSTCKRVDSERSNEGEQQISGKDKGSPDANCPGSRVVTTSAHEQNQDDARTAESSR